MPAFQQKTIKFANAGQNWNRPVDLIPEGQVCFAKNIRVQEQGEVTSRAGVTSFATLPAVYTHSISRLNNTNSEVNYDFTYIIGADTKLYVGKAGFRLTDPALNPVKLPVKMVSGSPTATPLSGNPLSLVDMAPVAGPTGWKYIGDSTQMLTVGYYPGDDPNYTPPPIIAGKPTMARCLTMGLPIPVNTTIPTVLGVGDLVGDYQWCFAFRRTFTGARSNPSVATRVTLAAPPLTLASQAATFTLPTTPLDPFTNAPDTNIVVDVYRFGGTIFRWALVGTDAGGATFNDNLADSNLEVAPSPPFITDPITGVDRFNIYQPFPTMDIARYGVGTIAAGGNGVYTLTWTSSAAGHKFNTNWIPGTTISIDNAVFSIYQVIDDTHAEITEDCASIAGSGKPWAVPEGAIRTGQALAHIWGPFSTGQTGAYIFGIGNTDAPGVLYWTNGNDPDSSDIANSLVVTSPSEPLMGGCVYDGTNLLWSTERMFRVYPSLTVAGQFSVEEVPGGKGMWGPYSLSIQTTGISDHRVTWLGKDGIYSWSINNGLESLTDDTLYPLFIHDNQPGLKLYEIFLWLTGETIYGPDFGAAALKYHRITWFDGMMFYDFPQPIVIGGPSTATYATLVYDSKQARGWVSVDQYYLTYIAPYGWVNTSPISRGIEVAANNMKIGLGGTVANYIGINDLGNDYSSRLITRAEDLGDPRMPKLWGDYMLDVDPANNTSLKSTPLLSFGATILPTLSITGTGRAQKVIDFSGGLGELSATFGLDLTWSTSASKAPPSLFQWQPSYVPKPEITHGRATDWTDDGEPQNKWVYGCLIEANTFGATRYIDIHMDGDVVIQTLAVNHNGQSTKPYYFTSPVITHQMRCVPLEPSTWELFRFIPKWNKKPEFTRFQQDWTDDGKPQPKYLQGFVLEGDTQGHNVSMQLWADQVLLQTFVVNHDGQLEKPYPVSEPPIIHEMRLVPIGNNIRYIDTFKLAWMYVIQPEFTQWIPDYTPSDPTAYHGVAIEADTENNAIQVDIVSEGVVVRTLDVQHNGRVQKAYTFHRPFTSTEVKLKPRGVWRQYPDWKVRWIGYPKPDLAALYTDWTDDGFQGAKFMQGFILHADTAGHDATITVEYDGGLVGGVFTKVNHVSEMQVAYSFPVPFIAHQLRAYPDIAIRFTQPFKIRWVWEPAPELAKNWITQTTSHQLRGWFHHRDCYIAIQSYDIVHFRIFDDSGGVNAYVFASTAGTVQKLYDVLRPQKALLVSYSVTSCKPFRLFMKDCEVRVGQWDRTGEYTVVKPFGGVHFERGAMI